MCLCFNDSLVSHKQFDELVALEGDVLALTGSLLIEGLHLVGLDAWIVDAEGHGLSGVSAMLAGRGMVGQQSYGYRLLPVAMARLSRFSIV